MPESLIALAYALGLGAPVLGTTGVVVNDWIQERRLTQRKSLAMSILGGTVRLASSHIGKELTQTSQGATLPDLELEKRLEEHHSELAGRLNTLQSEISLLHVENASLKASIESLRSAFVDAQRPALLGSDPNAEQTWLTSREAAAIMRVTDRQVRNLVQLGRLGSMRRGKQIFVDANAAREYSDLRR